jgi:hypothetical protein
LHSTGLSKRAVCGGYPRHSQVQGDKGQTHAAAVTEYVLKTLVDGFSIPTVMGLLAAQLMQNESFRFLYHHHNQRISSRSRLTLACKRKIWKQATPPVQYKGGLLPQ